jgi:hypothetical protein
VRAAVDAARREIGEQADDLAQATAAIARAFSAIDALLAGSQESREQASASKAEINGSSRR